MAWEGIGKTTLAQAYMGRHIHDYQHIAWVTQLSLDFAADLVSTEGLLDRLCIDRTGKDIPGLYEEAMAALGTLGPGPNLLVIDNAFDAFQPLRPHPAGTAEVACACHLARDDSGAECEGAGLSEVRKKPLPCSGCIIPARHSATRPFGASCDRLMSIPSRSRSWPGPHSGSASLWIPLQQAIENDLRAGVYTNYQGKQD